MNNSLTPINNHLALAPQAYEFAQKIASSELIPKGYRGKPGDIVVAFMKGSDLGLSPFQALDSLYVVNGKATISARAMHAVALSKGHEIWVDDATPNSVSVKGRRAGSDTIMTFTWSLERAAQAGYTRNALYKSNPQEMLTAKALAEACRVICPDALLGVEYSSEEMRLEDAGEAVVIEPVKIENKPAKTGEGEALFESKEGK